MPNFTPISATVAEIAVTGQREKNRKLIPCRTNVWRVTIAMNLSGQMDSAGMMVLNSARNEARDKVGLRCAVLVVVQAGGDRSAALCVDP